MAEVLTAPTDGLPALPDYWAPPEDPRKIAAPYNKDLADLYTIYGGDGLRLALAPTLSGQSRIEVAQQWRELDESMPGRSIDERRAAVRTHVAGHFNLEATGVVVRPAEAGMNSLDYARHVLSGPLLKQRREEDTELRLRTRYDFLVPGTRFDDPFPADNAIAALGLLADRRIDAALKTIANIEYDTMRFGYAENFSKLAMLREQTELDSFAMEATVGIFGGSALLHWKDALLRNINFMHEGQEKLQNIALGSFAAHRRIGRLPTGQRPHRNWDDTPVDYATRGVIRIESAEKDRETGERATFGIRDEAEKAAKWIRTQQHLAVGAASFEDMSDYQLKDRINLETTRAADIYTSWRQATAAHKIALAAEACELSGEYHRAERLWQRFSEIQEVVDLTWVQTGENKGHHTDLLLNGEQTGALNAAQILPLLVGRNFVPYDKALMAINLFREKLLGQYGLDTSDIVNCPEQWSGDRDWPSLAILAMHASMQQACEAKKRGEDYEPFIQFAEDVREALINGIEAWYEAHQTLPERIKGTDPKRIALGGEYCSADENGNEPEPQIGFAMTAGALMNAKLFNLRDIFKQVDPSRSWLSQCFATNLERTPL